MLKLHFINVADGDAVLIEDIEKGKSFRMLVDTGRPEMKISEGSLRQTCCEYLRKAGIDRIDVLVITHLHFDHAGGLRDMITHVSFGDLYAAFIPEHTGEKMAEEPEAPKTVRGMIDCVNRFSADAAALRMLGCRLNEVSETLHLSLTDALSADIILSDPDMNAHQHTVWNGMIARRDFSVEDKIRASKTRNPNSLRVRLHYAGREIELAGDCYGAQWEDRAEKCDILKVPHHGDAKSLTPKLVKKLSPEHAVICCMREYLPNKDRPSMDMVNLLREQGARVWFTDAYEDGMYEPRFWHAVEFMILGSGAIVAPQE